jgi:dTDP-4-amino-4,6-dideoxygalactose transaminase
MEARKSRGIQTSIHYPPIHEFTAYQGAIRLAASDLSITEEVAGREVTLPLYPAMSESDVRFVAEAVCDALKSVSE